MFLYKRYPKKTDFESVAQQIVSRYPFMMSPLERAVSVYYKMFDNHHIHYNIHINLTGTHNQDSPKEI